MGIRILARHRMDEKDFITVFNKAEKEEKNGNGTVTYQFIKLTEQYLSLQAISEYEKKSVDFKIIESVVNRWTRMNGLSNKDIIINELPNRILTITFDSNELKELYESALIDIKKRKKSVSRTLLRLLEVELIEFGFEINYDGASNIICKK